MIKRCVTLCINFVACAPASTQSEHLQYCNRHLIWECRPIPYRIPGCYDFVQIEPARSTDRKTQINISDGCHVASAAPSTVHDCSATCSRGGGWEEGGGGVPGYLWAEKVSVPSTDCVLTRSTMVNTPWTAETCSSLPTCVLSQRRVAAWRQGAAGGADAAGGGQLVGAGHRRVCRFRLAWLHHRVPVLPCWLRGAPLACTHARPGCCSAGPRLHTDAQDPPCIALPVLRLPAVVMWVFSVCSCAQWPFRWMVWY